MAFDPQASLRTARLELRPLVVDDVDALWPYVTNPELPRFMTWDPHRDKSETRAFAEGVEHGRAAGTAYVWTIRVDGAVCGLVGLHDVVRTMRAWRQERAELGYWIAPELQGRGLVTEAARRVLDFAFDELLLHKVIVGCISDNVASRRVIEKLGFRFLCEQRDHMFRFDRWWNHLQFEMVVDERRR